MPPGERLAARTERDVLSGPRSGTSSDSRRKGAQIMFQIVSVTIRNALVDRKAVTATEYTLMVVGIAALVIAGATALGGDISTALNDIGTYLTTAAAAI